MASTRLEVTVNQSDPDSRGMDASSQQPMPYKQPAGQEHAEQVAGAVFVLRRSGVTPNRHIALVL
jgi:hypothetical protein